MRFKCANRISTFLRCRREARPASLCPMWRARSRAPSNRARGTLRTGSLGQQRGLRWQTSQSYLLAR